MLGATEVHGAAIVAELVGPEPGVHEVVLAFALALWAPQHGHSCIELDTVAEVVAAEQAIAAAEAGDDTPAAAPPIPWPGLDEWLTVLRTSAAVRDVEAIDHVAVLDERPLVLFGRKVYTQRQWVDECAVAVAVHHRGTHTMTPTLSIDVLDRLLPPLVEGVENRQHTAAAIASAALLTVIAGGPGTGKTHTVAGFLAAELAGSASLRIRLAAPTGKAASRLAEAVVATAERGRADGELDADVAARLAGLRATTVHRLLGPRPDHRTRFSHDADDPLDLDVLVVDESSMLALPLTARLLAAVPAACRLVLVGDPDQLHSIEVGTVLADLVAAGRPGGALGDHVVRLVRQHRTGEDSPIGPLAEAIRSGAADTVIDMLRASADQRLRFVEVVDGTVPEAGVNAVLNAVGPAYSAARDAALAEDRSAAFIAAASARILCAHRRGPYGVAAWNEWAEERVTGRDAGIGSDRRLLPGRPLLATRNDPRTGLANGDPGVLARVGSATRAVFRRSGELVTFDLAELDAVDTAYALTVHKSQGSEYATVAVVHPPADSPLVSRELLYTAVTRTVSQLVVVASVASIRRAVLTPTRRVSGLAGGLAGADADSGAADRPQVAGAWP